MAPQLLKKLPIVTKTVSKPTKLEVRVVGRPKPEVKWFKQGEEIKASEEFQIENFEDGTSVLIINDIYPDDTGEITFQAHNPLGVTSTTTLLEVTEGNFSKIVSFRKFTEVFLLYYVVVFLRFLLSDPCRSKENLFYNYFLLSTLIFPNNNPYTQPKTETRTRVSYTHHDPHHFHFKICKTNK